MFGRESAEVQAAALTLEVHDDVLAEGGEIKCCSSGGMTAESVDDGCCHDLTLTCTSQILLSCSPLPQGDVRT